MRKAVTRLVVPALVVAGVLVALLAGGTDGPKGERTASAAPAVRPYVDPGAAPAAVPRRPHVVLLLLDELPGDSLLDGGGRIDALRFPSLARLAASATWFPNAHTVYDSTPKAIPLILDGKRPFKGQSPDRRGHPRTIFDMFGRRGYRVVASEEATAICPPRWCKNARRTRPGILGNLNRGRVERLERFFASVRPSTRPTFWMKHALLPHGPYLYLPSGARTRNGAKDPVPGLNSPAGFGDRFVTRHNQQRYLLQLMFVDRQLGRLFERLDRSGMFDDALIVVVADHGYAWKVGVKDRRKVNDGNVDEVAPVPLLVKAPGQRRGRIDRSYVSTLDVTPTVADVLGLRLPYRADGRSAFSRAVRRRRVVALPTRDFSRTIRISARRYEARRRAKLRRRLDLFGSGLTGLYSGIGPQRQLVGQALPGDLPAGASGVRARITAAASYRRVRRASGIVPAHVTGVIAGGRRGVTREIAVAVNGRIEATGRSFRLRGDRAERFAVMVPEETLIEGRNTVDVLEIGRRGTLRTLARS
ncbi:MAG TPA: sulfatase-like hydrolase/transferase [Thermoleophilaceae bacterium]|nr:sulfatase-like hydrolase/transferase [Thermoleophilaceae bacterium]